MNYYLKPIPLKMLDDPHYYLGEFIVSNQECNAFLSIPIGFGGKLYCEQKCYDMPQD